MMLMRTAKSCGSDAPWLASSLREDAQATVTTKPGHRGGHEVSRKTIARGMPGLLRCTCGDYARVLCFILHARLRVHWAPGIPCALCYRGTLSCKARAHRAARSWTHTLGCLKIESISAAVPDKRANGSRERATDDRLRERDPGPISTNVRCYTKLGPQRTYQHASVAMGPRVPRGRQLNLPPRAALRSTHRCEKAAGGACVFCKM